MSYDILMHHHLPIAHPEILADGVPDFEEVSYDVSYCWYFSSLLFTTF